MRTAACWPLPVGRPIGSVLVVTTVPIVAGMLLRRRAPASRRARAARRPRRHAVLRRHRGRHLRVASAHHPRQPAVGGTGDPGAQLRVMGLGYGLVTLAGVERGTRSRWRWSAACRTPGWRSSSPSCCCASPSSPVAAVVYALTMNFGALGLCSWHAAGARACSRRRQTSPSRRCPRRGPPTDRPSKWNPS